MVYVGFRVLCTTMGKVWDLGYLMCFELAVF